MNKHKLLTAFTLFALIFLLFAVIVTASDYFIVNKTTGKFHLPSCSYLPDYGNRYTIERSEIEKYPSLSPCGHCKPLTSSYYSPANSGQSSSSASSDLNKNEQVTESPTRKSLDYDKVKETFTNIFITGVVISIALFIIFALITFIDDKIILPDFFTDVSTHLINAAGIIFALSVITMIIGGIVLFFIKLIV